MNSKESKRTKTKSKEAKTEGSGNTVEKSQGNGGTCSHVRHRITCRPVRTFVGPGCECKRMPDTVCLNTAKLKTGLETIRVLLVHFDKYTFIWKARSEFRIPGFLGFCHWNTVMGES